MFLECRIDEETVIYIDAEAAGGVSKDQMANDFHPDQAIQNVVNLAAAVARKLSEAAAGGSVSIPAPMEISLDFGIRIDSDAVVSLSRNLPSSQFTVRVRWRP